MRVVLDTNIVISALFWKGLPRVVFDAALDKQFVALSSETVTAELKRVLQYPKFARQIASNGLQIDRLVDDYMAISVSVFPVDVPPNIVRDPKDRMVLACAVGGQAEIVVSGDKDLLVLGQYENISILTVDQFLQRLSATSS